MDYRLTDLFVTDYKEESYIVGDASDMTWFKKKKKRLHIFALGDVGSTLLMGLKLMGKEEISEIGIYDVRENVLKRFEAEMNQMAIPWEYEDFPEIEIVDKEHLFECDVFVFCASLGIPPITETKMDVRMAQYQANSGLVKEMAKSALDCGYQGLFAIVSDPVDPLCQAAASVGFSTSHIKGYGLGVMNARAAYYAKKYPEFSEFLTEGYAFGPHGGDLVIANSIKHYDDEKSKRLTELTVKANVVMRENGFKPYMAPAISSGALSILATISGRWHYSSTSLDGVFFGAKNRVTECGLEVENTQVPECLFKRIERAYANLKALV